MYLVTVSEQAKQQSNTINFHLFYQFLFRFQYIYNNAIVSLAFLFLAFGAMCVSFENVLLFLNGTGMCVCVCM